MSADFNPLDSSQRGKVTGGIEQLLNSGLSMDQIMSMYRNVSSEGNALLKQRYNALQYQLGGASEGYEAARDRAAGDPILSGTGYGRKIDQDEWSGVMGRLGAGYLGAAADQTSQDIGFLGGLYSQRAGSAANLQGQGYQSFFGREKKQTTGDKALGMVGQIGGSAAGAAMAGGGGAAAAAPGGSKLTRPGATSMYYEPQTLLKRPTDFSGRMGVR